MAKFDFEGDGCGPGSQKVKRSLLSMVPDGRPPQSTQHGPKLSGPCGGALRLVGLGLLGGPLGGFAVEVTALQRLCASEIRMINRRRYGPRFLMQPYNLVSH
jgi:hypothetical protein